MLKKKELFNIEAICFFVDDIDKCRKHYEEIWGFVPKRIQPDLDNPNFVEYDFKRSTFAIWERGAVGAIMGVENLMDEAHNFMTAIKLETIDEVDELYNHLIAKGVRSIAAPVTYSFGSRAAYVADIENNIWELFAWVEGGDGPALQDNR